MPTELMEIIWICLCLFGVFAIAFAITWMLSKID